MRTTHKNKNIFARNLLILWVNKIFVTFLRIFSLSTTIGGSKMGMFPPLMGIMHEVEKVSFREDLSVRISFLRDAFPQKRTLEHETNSVKIYNERDNRNT
jgi:hypothetical protein